MNLLRDETNKPAKFAYDIENEIKENPARGKEILEQAEEQIQDIKNKLRKGAAEKEYQHLDVLLHGYTALKKVLKKVTK